MKWLKMLGSKSEGLYSCTQSHWSYQMGACWFVCIQSMYQRTHDRVSEYTSSYLMPYYLVYRARPFFT